VLHLIEMMKDLELLLERNPTFEIMLHSVGCVKRNFDSIMLLV
jgi:hypothetical protein